MTITRRATATLLPLLPMRATATLLPHRTTRLSPRLPRRTPPLRMPTIATATATSFLDDSPSDTYPTGPSPSLYNADLAPTPIPSRTLGVPEMIALWIGLVVCIPNWYIAGSLVELGMSWYEGLASVLVGNVLCLGPLLVNAHAGTKYGIPFPVAARAAFGVRGASFPAGLRALVACGWFGIQSWVGTQALLQVLASLDDIFITNPNPNPYVASPKNSHPYPHPNLNPYCANPKVGHPNPNPDPRCSRRSTRSWSCRRGSGPASRCLRSRLR